MSIVLRLDYETRSTADISLGSYQYAMHPDTRVMCACLRVEEDGRLVKRLAFRFDPTGPKAVPMPQELAALWPRSTVRAWNVSFEQNVTQAIGWPEPLAWRCTMAQAAAQGMPQGLDKAAAFLGLEGKHKAGYKVMKKFCCPDDEGNLRPLADMSEDDWTALLDYCAYDVEIDASVDERVGDLIPSEIEVWRACNKINARGIAVDRELCQAALAINDELMARAGERIALATQGALTGADLTNPQKVKAWANAQGVPLEDIDAMAIAGALRRKDLPDAVREVLLARRTASKTSLNKLKALLSRSEVDGRIRNQLKYRGAQATGRWKSEGEQTWRRETGVQIQNLPRPQVKDVGAAIRAILSHDIPALEEMTGGDIEKALVSAIRPALVSSTGNLLLVNDWSGIEARICPWLCEDEKHLQWWRDYDEGKGPDGYCLLGPSILGHDVTKADKEARNCLKESWLSGQYQVGWPKFEGRARDVYGVDFAKVGRTPAAIIAGFRKEFYLVKQMWDRLQKCVLWVLDNHRAATCGRLSFDWRDDSLVMILPSGRSLKYRQAAYEMVEREYEGRKYMAPEITFKDYSDGSPTTGYLYGGKILQNATQGLGSDILAATLVKAEAAGLAPVLHTHDEVGCDVPEANANEASALLDEIMKAPLPWAPGLPLSTEGYITRRYAKAPLF